MENNTTSFSYNVQIGHGADMLRNGVYKIMPNCGQVVITSKNFVSYAECEGAMNSLMAALTRIESNSSDKNYVIVSKINPVLDETGKKHNDATTWDRNTIMRAYIADSEELKKATLKFHVMAQIRSDLDVTKFKADIVDEVVQIA